MLPLTLWPRKEDKIFLVENFKFSLQVLKTSIHPRYRTVQGFAEFDVAIITLRNRLEFSPYIHPVCLPSTQARKFFISLRDSELLAG